MEIDDDNDDPGPSVSGIMPLTCIKHVTFIPKMPPYEVYKVSQVNLVNSKCVYINFNTYHSVLK